MKKFREFNVVFLAIILLSATSACNLDDGVNSTPLPESNIIEVASGNTDISSLVAAIERAELTSTLSGSAKFTVLAPTNTAFDAFLAANGFGSVNDVPVPTLKQILRNHVISGVLNAANLAVLQRNYLESLANGPVDGTNLALYFDATEGGVTFNGQSDVIDADILASNGVIHIVDAVVELPTLDTFISTDENFEDMETALDLISPVSDLPNEIKDGQNGPFTLFVPSTEAFQALLDSNSDWEFLSDIDEALLTSVIAHHAVNGNIRSEGLAPETVITTLEGDEITINSLDGNVEITDGSENPGSGIVIFDIQALNGVIHIIDNVLIPDTTN